MRHELFLIVRSVGLGLALFVALHMVTHRRRRVLVCGVVALYEFARASVWYVAWRVAFDLSQALDAVAARIARGIDEREPIEVQRRERSSEVVDAVQALAEVLTDVHGMQCVFELRGVRHVALVAWRPATTTAAKPKTPASCDPRPPRESMN